MKRDPQENDPKVRIYIDMADKEADLALAESPQRGQLGFCHQFWAVKQRILKEKYGIDWKTPAEMNEDILFD